MGNQETLPNNIQTLKQATWVEAGQDQQNALFSNVNPYRRRLLANIMTHQLIEEYQLNFITQQDYNSYISELAYRQLKPYANSFSNNNSQQESFVFPIRYFVNKSRNQMCTTIHTGYLYTDKVDLRLKQINDIPFQDLLYMYMATLNGFKTLYQKVGYFDIVEEMIFITRKGEVKVWMNSNLAKNYPNYDKNSTNNFTNQQTYSKKEHQNLHGSQADMIRKLILLIEKNSDEYEQMGEPQHQLFSQFLQSKNLLDKLSFQHSLEEFQNYLHQNNLHCPHYMKSIPQLFCPEENNHNPTNYELSHVNQITTQQLTQIKKNFHPMETIPEDQKYPSETSKTLIHNQNSYSKFHQSQVAPYQFNNIGNPLPFKTPSYQFQTNKISGQKQAPYNEMGRSHYSQTTLNQASDHDYLNKSSNSININLPSKVQKPNSVSNLQYQTENSKINTIFYQHPPQTQMIYIPQNFVMQKNLNHNFNEGQQLPPYQSNQFRYLSNIPIQQYQNKTNQQYQSIQNIKLVPIQQFTPTPSFLPINVQNQQSNRIENQPFRKIEESQGNFKTQNSNFIEPNSFNQNNNSNSLMTNLQQNQQNSVLKQSLNHSQQSQTNSKIKYFTTKDTYQLDDEIANDLQKFLGLKVK